MESPEHPLFEAVVRALGGAALGACLGVLLLGVGMLRAAIAFLSGARVSMDSVWPAFGLYVLGFAGGGAVMGALWPAQPVHGRQYLAGALGGMVVGAAVARIVDGPSAPWTLATGVFVTLFGGLLGLGFTRGFLGPPAA